MPESRATLKTCSIRGETKPLELFTVYRKNKDGHTARCRPCVNAANKLRYAGRSEQTRARLRFFNKKLKDDKAEKAFDYLTRHPCVDCGESDPVVLEFDHRDAGTKDLRSRR